MRVFVTGLFVATAVGVAAVPVAAQPTGPLDVAPIIAELDAGARIVRAPDAVAHINEMRARNLPGSARVVVLPYRDESSVSHDVYAERVLDPMRRWTLDNGVSIVVVTGLHVSFLDGLSSPEQQLPASLDELRTTTSTRDVTERLLILLQFGTDAPRDAGDYLTVPRPTPVPASPDRVSEVATALRSSRIYNAPGRGDAAEISGWAEDVDLTVRIAAFPTLEPGAPVVDYATPLGEAFPDDVILVLHGDWIDVAAPDQDEALAARAFAYGIAGPSLLSTGNGADAVVRQLIERLAQRETTPSFGQPQPDPPPHPGPFDAARTISAIAPWVLVGSAVVLAGVVVLRYRSRVRTAATAEAAILRAETAATMAAITDLGARMLSVEVTDPVAAERHATARLLYDQAVTSAAMVEVRRVAEEGIETLTDSGKAANKKKARKKRKTSRLFSPLPPKLWRKSR